MVSVKGAQPFASGYGTSGGNRIFDPPVNDVASQLTCLPPVGQQAHGLECRGLGRVYLLKPLI